MDCPTLSCPTNAASIVVTVSLAPHTEKTIWFSNENHEITASVCNTSSPGTMIVVTAVNNHAVVETVNGGDFTTFSGIFTSVVVRNISDNPATANITLCIGPTTPTPPEEEEEESSSPPPPPKPPRPPRPPRP